jgi:hypothetical protein
MTKKTENKWSTVKCGRCDEPHENYSGKLDANNIEYVVCGITNKRINVNGIGIEGNSFAYPTNWVKEDLTSNEYLL